MSFSYANPGSGPSAGGIGWFNFSTLTINPGDKITGLTGVLNDGTTVTFDISSFPTSLVPYVASPATAGDFGSSAYTGLLGNTILYTPVRATYPTPSTLVLNNIVLKDSHGNAVTNYTTVVADGESTNQFAALYTESWSWLTNGGNWKLLTVAGSNPPTLAGLGTNTATITGINAASAAAYVLTTQSPTSLTLASIGREAVAIGFATTKVNIQKNIGARIDSSDQFVLNIGGTPNNQVTTTGVTNGIQTEVASVYAIPGNIYTINEAMAPGSASTLTDYKVITSAVNNTLGGSIPPTGLLPISVTPQLGDNISYEIVNAAPETFTKTVDKVFADIGEVLTYTVTINNPNSFAVNNVVMTDVLPAGTTYVDNLIVNLPFTGTNPATGITINTIPANSFATVSWQVSVNDIMAGSQINNVASIVIPNGTSGNTNVVTTTINNADLTSSGNFIKTVNHNNAQPGDIITYTLSLMNTGNVAANGVVIKDVIPAGTSYVSGSISSTLPFTGDPTSSITLTSPIAPLATETITFKIIVGNSIPTINPIPNVANVVYTYTVDPAFPNGVTANGTSNIVTTNISQAIVTLNKTADKTISYIGDTITYSILVKNSGNVPADNIIITDVIPNGTSYVAGSVTVNVPFTGSPLTSINFTNPLAAGDSAVITFKLKVDMIPVPNPLVNQATSTYDYTVNPLDPNGASATSVSNKVSTLVFKNNYAQQINDLIESVALEEAALSNIANQEGAKIQAVVAMNDVTPEQLLCVNKSVQDLLDSIGNLETILKQKLNIVNCQINGCTCC